MRLGDINGNVGRYIDGIQEKYGVGQRKFKKILLDFCREKYLSEILRSGSR